MITARDVKYQGKRTYKNHIGVTHPEIAKTLHPEKNYYLVEHLTHGSDSRVVWWQCPDCGAEWACTPFRRIHKKQDCPSCTRTYIAVEQSFAYQYPNLLKEWAMDLNAPTNPYTVSVASGRTFWWRCQSCQDEWKARVCSRTSNNSGCPVCQRKKHREYLRKINLVERKNSLKVTHPQLEIAWDVEKNLPTTFKHVSAGSNRKTWWKCPHCEYSFSKRTFSLINHESLQVCKCCKKRIDQA